jgi:C4-dicarboxylate-specific signal transduction histidine kinase
MEQLQKAYAELALNQEALRTTMSELKSSNEQLKEAQLRLIQSAKLETVGTLAAGVAHEVKNPLQTILMGLDFLVRNVPMNGQNASAVLQDMREAVTRANAIISELLQLSSSRDFDLQALNVNELIERALRLVNNEVIASRTRVELELAEGLPPVRMDKSKIEQVLINLFINALQAMSQEGLLTVRTRQESYNGRSGAGSRFNPGDALVIIEVQDTGPGIANEHLSRVFDPFFTTKPVGEGTGLGLSVVRQIVELHGGLIELKNAPQGGAVATICLKAAANVSVQHS